MNVPTIDSQNSPAASLQDQALALHGALRAYPHYAILRGYPPTEERGPIEALALAICNIPDGAGAGKNRKISFTRVRIDLEKLKRGGGATHYSRTHMPLAPHTDSSYSPTPHELVVFQMVRSDDHGGDSVIVPIEDLLPRLTENAIACLREPVFPLGGDPHPILWGETDACQIRYYRNQIDKALQEGASLTNRQMAAITELDEVLVNTDAFHRFHLRSGDVLFMHNTKVLHGRTGFDDASDRLMYRYRLYAPGLEGTPSTPPESPKAQTTPIVKFAPPVIARAAPPANPAGKDEPAPQERDGELERWRDRVAQSPDEAEVHMRLATELENQGQLEESLAHYRRAVDLKPDDDRLLEFYGDVLLQLGNFKDAFSVYRRCLTLNPDNYDAGLAMSSLLREAGKDDAAQEVLAQVMRRHPYVLHGRMKPEKPTILRIRGIERSAYGIWRRPDGLFDYILRGGHFSIRDLVRKNRFNLFILNAFENNLDGMTELPRFDIIVNTIACPDLKRESLLAAARFVDRYPSVPLINHPRRILETSRDRNHHRLNVIDGVHFPKTERVWWDGRSVDRLVDEIHGLGFIYPLIIRRVGTQTGTSIGLIQNETMLRDYLGRNPGGTEYYCIEYKDVRRSDGLYGKTRTFCIDGRYYPVANLLHDEWQIHSGDRYSVMADNGWTQEREKAYLGDFIGYIGEENFNKLRRIRDLLQLDFFGVDFTILDDGSLFIFEINAAMRHNYDHVPRFPYTKPYLQRISRAFHAMVEERARTYADAHPV